MRTLSLWAKHHAPAAISIIIAIKIILAFLAIFIGRSLSSLDYNIPLSVCILAITAFVIAACIYPSRNASKLSKKKYYVFQKSMDFTLALCTFIIIATLANNNFRHPASTMTYASTTITNPPTAAEILASLQFRDKSSLTKTEKKILKKEFKNQLKIVAKATIMGDREKADKGLLILLTIIGALGLVFLLARLACNISCGGAEGAAIVVTILGLAGIAWLTIALIRRISRGPRETPESKSN